MIAALCKRINLKTNRSFLLLFFPFPRYLIEVLAIVNQLVDQKRDYSTDLQYILKTANPAYLRLVNQLEIVNKVIEEVVTFQHGGLNNSLDTMRDVVKEYTEGRTEIKKLQSSLKETKNVLTAKKEGQIPLKELWMKKVELRESLRMVRDLEELKVCLVVT